MTTRTRFTRADLERIPTDAYGRHEIIDGELVVSPSPYVRHARAVARLFTALQAWVATHGGEVLPGDVDLYIAEHQNLVPDLLLVREEHRSHIGERFVDQPPDLVIEVSSSRDSRRRDLGRKRAIYASFGVPEYWVADLDDDVVLVFSLADDHASYREPTRHGRGQQVVSGVLDGFEAPVDELLANR